MSKIHFHTGDLPDRVDLGREVAVDTEAMGLDPFRDALCVVQMSAGDGTAHIVQLERSYDCPRLKALFSDPFKVEDLSLGRFDIAMMKQWLGITCAPVWCTKIASKLARTYTDQHGLKHVAREIAGIDLSKAQQSSDWGAQTLSDAQLEYAASDVLHLHAIKDGLEAMLARENRLSLAQACFDFLPVRADLDLAGWAHSDIFRPWRLTAQDLPVPDQSVILSPLSHRPCLSKTERSSLAD